ncbi:hypothetical protein CBL_00568 [Carabus blaptoides fortunei]
MRVYGDDRGKGPSFHCSRETYPVMMDAGTRLTRTLDPVLTTVAKLPSYSQEVREVNDNGKTGGWEPEEVAVRSRDLDQWSPTNALPVMQNGAQRISDTRI